MKDSVISAAVVSFFLATPSTFAANPTPDSKEALQRCVHSLALTDTPPITDFLAALQTAVKADDAAAVSKLVQYPLRINGGQKKLKVGDPAAFIKNYPVLFTKKVKAAILETDQAKLFCNSSGLMLGDGKIWISPRSATPQVLGIMLVNTPKN